MSRRNTNERFMDVLTSGLSSHGGGVTTSFLGIYLPSMVGVDAWALGKCS
jgi:hypothetical protein